FARLVSGNYFQVLGVGAAAGRILTPSDDDPGAPLAAVVSFDYWTRVLNGDRGTIGTTLNINGVGVAIVRVTPPGFCGARLDPAPPSFWLPVGALRVLNPTESFIDDPDSHWLYLIGRLRPTVSAAQAQERLTVLVKDWLRARAGGELSASRL